MSALRNVELRVFGRLPIPAPRGLLGRLAFWLLVVTAVTAPGHWLPGVAGSVFVLFSFFSLCALLFVLVPLVWRHTVGRFLWKVRNRLIVTYLLMGFVPVILFSALAAIAMYTFLGQFAIFAATAELDRSLQEQDEGTRAYALHLSHLHQALAHGEAPRLPVPDSTTTGGSSFFSHVSTFVDGKPTGIEESTNKERITHIPSWVPQHFHGIVLDRGRLYLVAVDTELVEPGPPDLGGAPPQNSHHTITVVSNLPLKRSQVASLALGLGRITIVPEISISSHQDEGGNRPVSSQASEAHAVAVLPNTISGGTVPRATHFFDVPVDFFAPLATTDWQTGDSRGSGVHITSRPTLLYDRLFSTSLQVAAYVQDGLFALAVFFGVLELVAFLMAMRLNQTITRSVSDLYAATLAIDSGDFTHRIAVTRNDQLAALSQSFNTMALSLERLLAEQREKERLQGELEIAQQVQANLFPLASVSLPTLEVYGICQPARTVSGDYYDFLVAGSSGLSLALGDISGKGISAALLMASLHSAVRAYRFMGEDMAASSPAQAARLERIVSAGLPDTAAFDDGEGLPLLAASFGAPGEILGLLNRHLYRSTQPEKYATLFLAHYDGRTAELIYSTGGQPPPLLLRADDSIVRLDCGGTVIGLIDAMEYEQGRETLRSGDIVIAYSDGVTEPENEFGDFGEDRLVDIVRRNRTLPLDQIAAQVLQSLRSWIGEAEQPDDITIVLARQR